MTSNEKQEKKLLKKQEKYNKRQEKMEESLKVSNKSRDEYITNKTYFLSKEEKKLEYRMMNEPPKRSTIEEVGNAVTHGIGALLGIAAMILLLVFSTNGRMIFSSLVYGISMIFMMLMSCLYHAFKSGSRVKRLWRRFDYTSIYLLIGGTFTPMFLLFWYEFNPTLSVTFFIIQWAVIIFGITFVCVFGPGRVKFLHYILYVLLGWCGIMFIPNLVKYNLPLFFFILFGGITYTIGLIPFALKKPAAHFIWHFFVLGGAIVHFIGILICLY